MSLFRDGWLRYWDAVTGDLLVQHTFTDGHEQGALAFGRVGDRDVVISHSFGSSVRLWDAVTADLLGEHTFNGRINAAAVGRVGGRDVLAVGSDDGVVWIQDVVNRESIHEIQGDISPVEEFAIGRIGDRDIIAVSSENDFVQIWDAVTGSLLAEPLADRSGHLVMGLEIDCVGDRDVLIIGIYSASDFAIEIWEGDDSHAAREVLSVPDARVEEMAIGPVGERNVIIAAFQEPDSISGEETELRKLRIWDAASSHPIGKPLTIEGGDVRAIAACRAGGRDIIVTGSGDGAIRVMDASEEALIGHAGGVSAVAVSRAGRQDVIISYSSRDKTARAWDVASGDLLGEPRTFEYDWTDAVALGRIGEQDVIVIAPRGESKLRILDVTTGHPVREPVPLEGGAEKIAIGRIRDRDVVVTASVSHAREGFEREGIMRILDAVTGDFIGGPFTVDFGWDSTVAIGRAGGRDVIITGDVGPLMIYDAATGACIRELRGGDEIVCALAIGRLGDRDVVVAGMGNKMVRIWDALTGQLVSGPLAGHDSAVTAVATGRAAGRDFIVSGSDDRTVVLREHRLL